MPTEKIREPQPLDTPEPAPFGRERADEREPGPRGEWQGYDVALLTTLLDG